MVFEMSGILLLLNAQHGRPPLSLDAICTRLELPTWQIMGGPVSLGFAKIPEIWRNPSLQDKQNGKPSLGARFLTSQLKQSTWQVVENAESLGISGISEIPLPDTRKHATRNAFKWGPDHFLLTENADLAAYGEPLWELGTPWYPQTCNMAYHCLGPTSLALD